MSAFDALDTGPVGRDDRRGVGMPRSVTADVIVVGLGTMGAAAAWQLARRGARVIGLDRFHPPHDRGSHAGGSRIIRLAYAEGADYVPLLRRAYPLWDELSDLSGVDLITRTGGLMIGRPDSEIVGGAVRSARTHDLAHEVLDPDAVAARFPAFTLADDEVALYEAAAGFVRPEAAIRVMLDLATRDGADLRGGVEVLGWRAGAAGVSISTRDGDLTADRLVVAPGGWAPELLVSLGVPLRVSRRVQHFYARPGGPDAAGYRPGGLPVWMWDYGPRLVAYGLPPADPGAGDPLDTAGPVSDPTVRGVKAALHHVDDPVDPNTGAAAASGAEVRAMGEWLAPRLPALARAEHLGAKSCLYTLTPDEHFVLGAHPEHPSVAVACGFSGHGFKFAPVVGEILADLVLEGATSQPIGLFDPARFAGA
jgi:sarcosine oxidase